MAARRMLLKKIRICANHPLSSLELFLTVFWKTCIFIEQGNGDGGGVLLCVLSIQLGNNGIGINERPPRAASIQISFSFGAISLISARAQSCH